MSKKDYRVRNWKEYNKALVNRGNITFWFDEEVIAGWHEYKKTGKRGRPLKYNDLAIECGLTLRALFKLPFRATQGLIASLIRMLKVSLEAPDYSLLCKRQKHIKIVLPKKVVDLEEKINLVVDTTGLKVYGEGEWKVRQHGWMKHRLWRKLHLAVNPDSHEIEAFELTELGIQDCEGLPMLLEQIKKPLRTVSGDGAYDRFSCYEEAEKGSFDMLTPPQKNSRTSEERRRNKKKASPGAVQKRDGVILKVREMGRKEWKIAAGYHRRSLAETAMFRIKTILGSKLSTQKVEHQKTEIAIWCKILNKMTELGMPTSVAI